MAQHPWSKHDKVLERGIVPSIDGDTHTASKNANNALQTLYTVPADRVFLLFSWNANARNTSGATGRSYFQVSDSGASLILRFLDVNVLDDSGHSEGLAYFLPIPFVTGDYFVIFSGALNLISSASIFGMLIDA